MKALISKIIIVVLISSLLLTFFSISGGVAVPTRGAITISFDDGFQTQYAYAFPMLQAMGMPGNFFIITSRVGTSGFMTVAQLQVMQNSGSEIDSHSVTHPDFTTLSASQIIQECQVSQNTLRSWGLTAKNFAYPSAARNSFTDSIMSQYYRSIRWGYVAPYVMPFPTSQFLLPAMDGSVSLAYDQSLVDQIYEANGWGIITFHDVSPTPGISQNHIGTADFQTFLNYVQSKGVAVLTIDQALSAASTPPPSSPGPSAVFGTTTVGGLSTTLSTVIPRATQYTPGSSGTVTDIMLYLTGTGHAQVAIYADSGNAPGALLAKSSSDAVSSNGWHDFSGFNVAVTGGVPYWLAAEADGPNLRWYYNDGGANEYAGGGGFSYGTFPNPFIRSSPVPGNYMTSIYAIYTPQSTQSSAPTAAFGTTSVGGLSATLYYLTPRATQYTPGSSGTVTDIMLYLTGTGHAQVAIYADSGNAPGALLAKSSSDAISSNGWHDFSGFNVAVTGGVPYWLAAEADGPNLRWYYNNGGANLCAGGGGFSYGTFPNPYIRSSSGNYMTSIYAIYH